MHTLCHTAAFERAAKAFTEDELDDALDTIGRNPECGDLIPGTGGVRKLRIAASGRGKRGGGRIIYFWFDEDNPIYLLFAYPKNQRDDLSAAQRNALKKLTAILKAEMRDRRQV
jgi:hypothetical protein